MRTLTHRYTRWTNVSQMGVPRWDEVMAEELYLEYAGAADFDRSETLNVVGRPQWAAALGEMRTILRQGFCAEQNPVSLNAAKPPTLVSAIVRRSLVPPMLTPAQRAPHYYSTWAAQGYMPGDGFEAKDLSVDWLYSQQGAIQGACANSSYIFGQDGLLGSGWARDFYPDSRSELFFMLDEGFATSFDTIDPNARQFPELAHLPTAAARLTALQQEAALRTTKQNV